MYKKVLVPLDGRHDAECVLGIAGEIAARSQAQLKLVHVSTTAEAAELHIDAYLAQTARRLAKQWAIDVFAGIVDDDRYDLDHKTGISGALFQHVCDTQSDLLVMARRARGGVLRAWLDSISKNMVRWCPAPVLLWRASQDAPQPPLLSDIRHIVVPLDGSPIASEALHHAVTMQRLLGNHVHLIRNVSPEDSKVSAMTLDVADSYLDGVAAELRRQGVPVTYSLTQSVTAGNAIIGFISSTGSCDSILAMTTHGYTGLTRVLLGSVAEDVLDRATVPVLLHRPIIRAW